MRRRTFLLGIGAGMGLLALPRRMRAARPNGPPRRLVIIMQNNGTQPENFWPAPGTFRSPILDGLVGNPRIASLTTVVRGVRVESDANDTDGNEHDMGFGRMWTGERLLSVAGHPWGGAQSIDQIVAQGSGMPSLNQAIYTSSIHPYPKPGFQHRRSYCYVAPGVHMLPTLDPLLSYQNLFWTGSAQLTPEVRRRLQLRQSALDVATAELRDLQSRLGSAERIKLDAHATAIRSVESRLSDQLAGRPGPGATCGARPAVPRDYQNTAPELLIDDESAIPDLLRTQMDLTVAAFACDTTRVATLQLGYAGGNWKFDWLGIGEDHHALAHLDKTDSVVDPAVIQKIAKLNRWYAEQVAYLAAALDAIPDGHGTLLDHTLIVWASEFGRGDHNQTNVPIVFVGGAGGALRSGGRVVDAGEQPFQRVGCTTLRLMGYDVAGFGNLPTCGPLQGL
jgi:hypothetical protein